MYMYMYMCININCIHISLYRGTQVSKKEELKLWTSKVFLEFNALCMGWVPINISWS